ncbi:MAG: hypothetical protein ACREPE_11510 [Lysobacter sp.]
MAGITQNGSPRLGDRWRIAIWGTAALLLLLPLVAMQFTDEVDWDETDFIVIGAMILPLLLGHPDKRFNVAIRGERDDQEEGGDEA